VEAGCGAAAVQGGAAMDAARNGRKEVAGRGCVEAKPRLPAARWWRGFVGRQVSLAAGGLVGTGAGCCEAVGVLRAWGCKTLSRFSVGLAVAAAAAVVDLLGGIAALLPHPSRTHLVGGVTPGETLDHCDRTMAAPSCRIPS
jgi:hypothetical protein